MSCCNTCGQQIIVNVPGTAGSTGTSGQNAYSFTTANFDIPAVNSDVTVLAVTAWLVVGQTVFIGDGVEGGTFEVAVINNSNSFDATFKGYGGDSAPGATITSGAKVSPAGRFNFADPVPVANGGTGVATVTGILLGAGVADIAGMTAAETLTYLSLPTQTIAGQTTLVTGFVTPAVNITASSKIYVSLVTAGGTRTGFAGYKITSITPGSPGSFVITAINDSAATLALCTDVVNYLVIN